jgi:hypothetical protein
VSLFTSQPQTALTDCLVWLAPQQVGAARAIVAAANLRCVVAGTSVKGRADAVASEFGCASATDVRAALAACQSPLALILDCGDFGSRLGDEDARAILSASARGVKIASLVPLPTSVQVLAQGSWKSARQMVDSGACERVHVLGIPRALARVRDAMNAIEADGEPRHVGVRLWSGAHERDASGLLVGGLDFVHELLGECESIDCVYASGEQAIGLHALPGETLEQLRGDCSCVLRFTNGASASVDVSSCAGAAGLEITLLGTFGRLHVRQDGHAGEIVWLSSSGDVIEVPQPRLPRDAKHSFASQIAEEITTLLQDEARGLPSLDVAALLPIAQAALLSARTGQPESPSLFSRVLGSPPFRGGRS